MTTETTQMTAQAQNPSDTKDSEGSDELSEGKENDEVWVDPSKMVCMRAMQRPTLKN